MQWQSGFAGLAEINMMPNKEMRWNRRFFIRREKEGDAEKKCGFKGQLFKATIYKGHMCMDAQEKDLSQCVGSSMH